MATGTLPGQWEAEDWRTIATVKDILDRQAEQRRQQGG